jgi:hypothetical protein
MARRKPTPILSIKVPASWVDHTGTGRLDPAEFTLGPGPCGLTVTRLQAKVADGCFVVKQSHQDGPPKVFIYPLAQLVGRVEVQQDYPA